MRDITFGGTLRLGRVVGPARRQLLAVRRRRCGGHGAGAGGLARRLRAAARLAVADTVDKQNGRCHNTFRTLGLLYGQRHAIPYNRKRYS